MRLLFCTGGDLYQQSRSEGKNSWRVKTMAGRWLGPDHKTEAGTKLDSGS